MALNLDTPIEEAMETLRRHSVQFTGPIDRGYERSIYFRDPNGLGVESKSMGRAESRPRPAVELITWITPLPEGAGEAAIIARATEKGRAGSRPFAKLRAPHHIEDRHVRQAMPPTGIGG